MEGVFFDPIKFPVFFSLGVASTQALADEHFIYHFWTQKSPTAQADFHLPLRWGFLCSITRRYVLTVPNGLLLGAVQSSQLGQILISLLSLALVLSEQLSCSLRILHSQRSVTNLALQEVLIAFHLRSLAVQGELLLSCRVEAEVVPVTGWSHSSSKPVSTASFSSV